MEDVIEEVPDLSAMQSIRKIIFNENKIFD